MSQRKYIISILVNHILGIHQTYVPILTSIQNTNYIQSMSMAAVKGFSSKFKFRDCICLYLFYCPPLYINKVQLLYKQKEFKILKISYREEKLSNIEKWFTRKVHYIKDSRCGSCSGANFQIFCLPKFLG